MVRRVIIRKMSTHRDKSDLPAEPRRVFEIAERFAGFSTAMSSLEALVDHKELGQGGIRRPSDVHAQDPGRTVIARLLFKALDRKWALVSLHAVRLTAGGALVLLPDRSEGDNRARGAIAGFIAASEGWLSLYNRHGSDGADQASIQALAPAAIGRLGPTRAVANAAICYTGVQGVLSYTVAGVAKLFGEDWRRGTAIEGILRTNAYGHEGLWRFFTSHPKLSKLVTWATVAWEVSYPLALLPYPVLTRMYSLSALAFHIVNAHFMGLGRFAWSFASLHPAIVATSAPSARRGASPLPRVTLGALILSISTLAAAAVLRNLNVRLLPLNWSRIETKTGNSLAVQFRRGEGSDLLVIEAGLAAPIETYQWFFDALCDQCDHSILIYERAGYGASKLAKAKNNGGRLENSVSDLFDVISVHASGHNSITAIGHSMGGEIIRRLNNRNPGLLTNIVLIDSTNINQFTNGSLSRSDVMRLAKSFRVQRNKTVVGLGALMNPTPGSVDLPFMVRKRGIAVERNHRLWAAALREYHSLLADLPHAGDRLFEGDVPRHVFAAFATLESESSEILQRQLADNSETDPENGRGVVTVTGRHDTMFTVPSNGVMLARQVLKAIESGR